MSFVAKNLLTVSPSSFSPDDIPGLDLWLDANEGVIKILSDPGIPATNTEETVGALVEGFPTNLGLFGDNPNGVKGRIGTLNGKARYQDLFWSLGNEPHWSTPRWVLVHNHGDYENDTDTHYFGFGDTQYPWQASWLTANGAYDIGSGGSGPRGGTYGTVTMNEFDDGIPPTPAVEAADGELVHQWTNKVSQSQSMSQDSSNLRPTFRSDVFGRKAVNFNGKQMSAFISLYSQGAHFYIVSTSLLGSTNNTMHGLIRFGTSTFTSSIRAAFGADSLSIGVQHRSTTYRGTSLSRNVTNNAAVFSARFQFYQGFATVRRNFTAETITSLNTGGILNNQLVLGSFTSNSTRAVNTNISEVLVYRDESSEHGEDTATKIIDYLVKKWNINTSL